MGIVLNEREFALDAINNLDLGEHPSETLGRIARYYRSEGYAKREIRGLLESFVVKCDPSRNAVMWDRTIDKQMSMVDKFKLVELDNIPISKKEIEVCNSLAGKQARRLLFALICVAKYNNAVSKKNNGWVNVADKEGFRMANIVTPTRRQSLMLGDLRDAGLIRFSKKVDNININVLCLDDDPDSEVALRVTDYRNLGYQYLRYCGEPYFECRSCGIVVKRGSNVQKYCHECAVDINRQNNRENYRNMVRAQ